MTKPLDLVIIPFHDWRKVQREGGRTRDAHLIEQYLLHPEVGRILIVNRPVSVGEMLYKRQSWKTKGEPIRKNTFSRLTRVNDNTYALDFFDKALLGPIINRKNWFFTAYGANRFVQEVVDCIGYLDMNRFHCLSFSLFAVNLVASLPAERTLFDAWDNFLKFPEYERHQKALQSAYEHYSQIANRWTTNSKSNRSFYLSEFCIKHCHVISNGVDPEKFSRNYELPLELQHIPRPIIGIGAKITHLLDCELINYIVNDNPDLNFVLIGQVLEKRVFRKINRRANFFYLGDKHYDNYPAYVQAFDVCLIPYVVGTREHGGDSIKFYEYLAANKPIVTTKIEGVSDQYRGSFIANNKVEFSKMIRQAIESPRIANHLPDRLTWQSKANELLKCLLMDGTSQCQYGIKGSVKR